MELTYDSYLEHYGVKGMKWGVRKSDKRRSPEQQARRDKAKSVAKKAAVGAAVIGGAAVLAYATRNTPQVQMAKLVMNSRKNVFKEDVSNLASKAAYKVGEARLNSSTKRAQRIKDRQKSNNDFRAANNIYEAAIRLNTNANPPKDAAVDRMIKKVDGGRSLKDAVFDESVRHGAKLATRYLKRRMSQKLRG